jgi:hypothetical protein
MKPRLSNFISLVTGLAMGYMIAVLKPVLSDRITDKLRERAAEKVTFRSGMRFSSDVSRGVRVSGRSRCMAASGCLLAGISGRRLTYPEALGN